MKKMKKRFYFLITLILVGFLFTKFYKFKYFDFDEVIHYKTEITEEELFNDKNKIDKVKKGIILEKIPNSIMDTTFIAQLEQIGFKKTKISPSRFEELNDIFSFKINFSSESSACLYIYRDIIVFKKKSKIVGISKICFDCNASEVFGANYNTNSFGQNGDYEKLNLLLNSKK
jgi:hypothetical protein